MNKSLANYTMSDREKAIFEIKNEMRGCDSLSLNDEVSLHNSPLKATSLEKEGNDIVVYIGEDRFKPIYQLDTIDLCSIADVFKS